jgi:hypothetical protein
MVLFTNVAAGRMLDNLDYSKFHQYMNISVRSSDRFTVQEYALGLKTNIGEQKYVILNLQLTLSYKVRNISKYALWSTGQCLFLTCKYTNIW